MDGIELFENSMNKKVVSSESIEEHITRISTEYNEYVVKTPDWDYASAEAEPHIINELRGEADIPLPKIHHISESPVFFIMDFLNGSARKHATELEISELCECARAIGEVLGRVQTVQRDDIGKLVYRGGNLETRRISAEDKLHSILRGLYNQAQQNFEFDMDLDSIEMPNPTDITYCPIDFNCTNFLFMQGELSGVVDFERVYSGPAGWGYCNTLHCLSVKRNMDEKRRISNAFSSGYGSVRELPDLHPTYEILAILREMRAAHIWWDEPDERFEMLLGMIQEKRKE